MTKLPQNEKHLSTTNNGLVYFAKNDFNLNGDPLSVIYFLMGRIIELEKKVSQIEENAREGIITCL